MSEIEEQITRLISIRLHQVALRDLERRISKDLGNITKEIRALSHEVKSTLESLPPNKRCPLELNILHRPTLDGWWIDPDGFDKLKIPPVEE